jgi:hypothetical protein
MCPRGWKEREKTASSCAASRVVTGFEGSGARSDQ